MLKHLYIKNFTLIDTLDIDLHPGFSVITGETGAGKSIILGAIALLLGQRADSKSLKLGADKCVVEAHFDLSRYQLHQFFEDNDIEDDPSDCILRRELTAAGKSRAFINDTPVQLALLRELGERLVDVHSQHQNLLLQKHDFQLSVLDIIADDAQQLADYRQAYAQWQETQRRLEQMEAELAAARQNADFMQFQYDELTAAQLVAGEQDELEQRSETMTHAEDIKSALYEADNALGADATGIVTQLRQAAMALQAITKVYADATPLAQRIDSAYIELKDVAMDVSNMLEDVDFDPAELESVNERLDRLYELEKKYQAERVEDLIDKRNHLQQQLEQIDNSDEQTAELKAQIEHEETRCRELAADLTRLRTEAARAVEQQLQQRLAPLGMPNVRFKVSMENEQMGRNGADKVNFLFSANTSTPLQPVAQVASGGEIARVMLSLKAMISGTVKLPTIIFDEIDTGVSGKIAEKMAEMMKEMGQHDRQVLSITHLPQIAAMGSAHYKVAKSETEEGTVTRMTELTMDERVAEIAQMLSGSDVTDAAIANARQLLKN